MVSNRIRLGIAATPGFILLVQEKRNEYDHVRPGLTRRPGGAGQLPTNTPPAAVAKAYD